jgi:hypothetical protein
MDDAAVNIMKNAEQWPQICDARIEAKNGRLYLCFQDGDITRRKLIGDVPAGWPKNSIPAGKKRYGKRRAEIRSEVEYHRPAKWKNRHGDRIPGLSDIENESGSV